MTAPARPLRATPDWDDARPDRVELETMLWQHTLPAEHPLKYVGPCAHCRYCRGPLLLGYDGPGSGWFHFYLNDPGEPFCKPGSPPDPEACDCQDWQAAIAAALDAEAG